MKISLSQSTLFLLSLFFGCIRCNEKTDLTKNYNNSGELAFDLIKQCVETMTSTNPSINTENYVLDLSAIDKLNRQGVDSFIRVKNSIRPTTLDDSTMIFRNNDPENFYMKQSMIIKIRDIQDQDKKIAIVEASKIRSSEEVVDAVLELRRKGMGYKVEKIRIKNR